MARKVNYLFPNLINSTNVSEWNRAYNNYSVIASVNNSAITGNDPKERLIRDAKMSQLALGHTPNLSAWSVQALASKIRNVFSLSGSDEDVIYNFMSNEFFIWKYGFSNHICDSNLNKFSKTFENDKPTLLKVFNDIFTNAVKSRLQNSRDKYSLIYTTASGLCGVSFSGASALLSLIFPDYIGTCDSVLLEQYNLNKGTNYDLNNRDKLFIAIIEDYMADQAATLNKLSNSNFWTPRKIDQAVWANRI